MKIRMAQLAISPKISENLEKMLDIVGSAVEDEWIVFPEGMLSGYFPEKDDFIKSLDMDTLIEAEEKIVQAVIRRKCHCLFGTVTAKNREYFNSVVYIDAGGNKGIYCKNNFLSLSFHHRTR